MESRLLLLLRAGGNDVDGALARFIGNAQLYERFLREFPREPAFEALAQAMEKGDAAAAHSAAHTLKGVAGNLGLTALFNAANALDVHLRAGDLAQAASLYPALRESYAGFMELLAEG